MDQKYAAMIESYSKFATGNPKSTPSQTVNGTIKEVAKKLGIEDEELIPFGHDKAKVSDQFIRSVKNNQNGKLILVTAVNPTPAGEGKTCLLYTSPSPRD